MIFASSSDLQAGFHTASTWDGLGAKGSDIPATGPNGAAFAYPSLDLPADNDVEIRGLITAGPTVTSGTGTIVSFRTFDDTSFMLSVTDSAVVEWTWTLFADGVAVQTGLTASVSIGGESVALSAAQSETRHQSQATALATLASVQGVASETRNENQVLTVVSSALVDAAQGQAQSQSSTLSMAQLAALDASQSEARSQSQIVNIASSAAQAVALTSSETRNESQALAGLSLTLALNPVASQALNQAAALSLDQYTTQSLALAQSQTLNESQPIIIDVSGISSLNLVSSQSLNESSLPGISAAFAAISITGQTLNESLTAFVGLGEMEVPTIQALTYTISQADYRYSIN